MGEKRRMHTVPASYLQAFAIGGSRRTPRVWRHSRSEGDAIAIGVHDAAVHRDIYAFENESGRRDTTVEDALGEVEGNFCSARKALVAGASLTIDQRVAIALHIAFQVLRTTRSLQLFRDEFAREVKEEAMTLAADSSRFQVAMHQKFGSEQSCDSARDSLLRGEWHYEADAFTGLHTMMNASAFISHCITVMDWTVYVSDGTHLLLTSDNPVTLCAERTSGGHVGTEVGLGFCDSEMRMSYPITPLISLVAEHTYYSWTAVNTEDLDSLSVGMRTWSPQLRYENATPNRVKILNHGTVTNADRYVYNSRRNASVDRFLTRYLQNEKPPVRRSDRRPVVSPVPTKDNCSKHSRSGLFYSKCE